MSLFSVPRLEAHPITSSAKSSYADSRCPFPSRNLAQTFPCIYAAFFSPSFPHTSKKSAGLLRCKNTIARSRSTKKALSLNHSSPESRPPLVVFIRTLPVSISLNLRKTHQHAKPHPTQPIRSTPLIPPPNSHHSHHSSLARSRFRYLAPLSPHLTPFIPPPVVSPLAVSPKPLLTTRFPNPILAPLFITSLCSAAFVLALPSPVPPSITRNFSTSQLFNSIFSIR